MIDINSGQWLLRRKEEGGQVGERHTEDSKGGKNTEYFSLSLIVS